MKQENSYSTEPGMICIRPMTTHSIGLLGPSGDFTSQLDFRHGPSVHSEPRRDTETA
jgi:hypothetical protein